MRQIALKYPLFVEAGYEDIQLTGDIDSDINTICENLRSSLHAAIEDARTEALEVSSEYDRILFKPGRISGAGVSLDLYATRQETPEEISIRVEQERKAEEKRLATVRRARAKDIEKIRELATKHNLPLAIVSEGEPEAESTTESAAEVSPALPSQGGRRAPSTGAAR